MEQNQLDLWASVLNEARVKRQPVEQLSHQIRASNSSESFSRAEAYGIQERQLKLRQAAGEKLLGWKMGLTSEAKRRQMNLDSPLYGFLTDQMKVADGGTFLLGKGIHPKVEPEIAFLIGQDLRGKVGREQVLAACEGVAAALEILDSRYKQFKYFSMEDVISDNSSSSHFVVGPWKKNYQSLDLKSLKMKMYVNGEVAQAGTSEAISGDPVLSVIQLCELLAERGQILKAGSLVLSGAATAAVELQDGYKVRLEVDHLEPISVNVQGGLS